MKPRSKPALCATSALSPTNSTEGLDHLLEARLGAQKIVGQPVHKRRLVGDRAARIDVGVKRPAGRDVVQKLDAADLDQPVAGEAIEAGRFGVEDDFPHAGVLVLFGAR